MPFGNLVSGSITFEPRAEGVYSDSSKSFSDPRNELRIRGATINKTGQLSGSVTRVQQKDVTIGGDLKRVNAVVTTNIQLPDGPHFTASELDSMTADISTIITASTISRIMSGES